jgi:hypothetical protein
MPGPKAHVRASCIVIPHPFCEDASQVTFCQRDHAVQAFPPQRAQQPLAEGVCLGAPHRDLSTLSLRLRTCWSSCAERLFAQEKVFGRERRGRAQTQTDIAQGVDHKGQPCATEPNDVVG